MYIKSTDLAEIADEPASMAQSDTPPTYDQEVVGSTQPGPATFFRGD